MFVKLFVGIDGGGTKTEICVINAAGLELTRLSGGPSNPQAIGFDDAVRELTQLLNQALSSIREDDGGTGTPGPERSEELGGLDKREVLGECEKLDKLGAPGQRWELGLCLGMAGVDTHEDRERVTFAIRSYFEQTGVEAKLLVTNDAEIVLMATLDRSFGVLAIAGTGSIVFGRTPDGDCYRVGGWGHLLGDEGSGYRIGLDTLHAVMRSYDGIDPPTAMTPMIEQAYGWERIVELRRYIYQPHIKKQDVAAFARYAIEAAAAGDPPARRLIERSAAALAEQTSALVRKHAWFAQADLVLSGSVFRYSELYRKTFRERLEAAWPDLRLHEARQAPAYGAARLALQLLPGE